MLPHGMVLWFGAKLVPGVGDDGDRGANMDGSVGVPSVDGLGPKVPVEEVEIVGAGTVIRGLTPALPISTDPNGIPVREAPLGDAEGADAFADAVPAEAAAQDAVLPGKLIPAPIPPPAATPPPS